MWTFGSDQRHMGKDVLRKAREVPAPFDYSPQTLPSQKQIVIGQKLVDLSKLETPGPGAYTITSIFKARQARQASRSRHSVGSNDSTANGNS